MKDIYQAITDKILAAMDTDKVVPWQKPWGDRSSAAMNVVSGKAYKGVNWLTLNLESKFASPLWMTFHQAKELGGNVKAGEKSSPIIFWKFLSVQDNATGEAKDVPFARHSNVFNIEQCDGVKIPERLNKHVPKALPPIEACEKIAANSGVKILTQGDRAYYSPLNDVIVMPPKNLFKSSEHYYQTLFHELGHASGHPSRLNREGLKDVKFGSEIYAKEELIAEITSCFLCAEAGIPPKVDDSTAYIQNWRKKLEKDPKLIVQAASAAQKASDHILGLCPNIEIPDASEGISEPAKELFIERIELKEPSKKQGIKRGMR